MSSCICGAGFSLIVESYRWPTSSERGDEANVNCSMSNYQTAELCAGADALLVELAHVRSAGDQLSALNFQIKQYQTRTGLAMHGIFGSHGDAFLVLKNFPL